MEIARQLPKRAKSIFAGFRPQTNRLEALPAERASLPDQRRAVERYARAAADIGQMREQGLPVLPHQRDALEKAGRALDAIRPNGTADLASALQRQPSLARDAADGRSQGAIRAMQLEAEIRVDPAQRADRFIGDWQRLGQARQAMQRDGDSTGAQRLTNRMTDMAKGLAFTATADSLPISFPTLWRPLPSIKVWGRMLLSPHLPHIRCWLHANSSGRGGTIAG